MDRRLGVLGLVVAMAIVAACDAFEAEVPAPDASAIDANRPDVQERATDGATDSSAEADPNEIDGTTNFLAGTAFETNCQGWSGNHESLSTSDVGRTDGKSCRVCRSGSGSPVTQIQRGSIPVPLQTGETLEFAVYAKAAPDASILKGDYIELAVYDADGGNVALANAMPVGATDWVETTVSVKASKPAVRAILQIRFTGGDAGPCALLDDARLVKK